MAIKKDIKPKELFLKIKKKDIASCYVFSGEEDFLKEKAIQELKKKIVSKDTESLNYNLIYGSDIDIDSFLNLIETYPFLAEQRLVVVKEFEKINAACLEKIVDYVSSPNSATCLVMVFSGRMDSKKTVFKKIVENSETVVFWPLFEKEIPGWIYAEVEKRGKIITAKATQMLQLELGNNLFDLTNEIDKLVMYVGVKKNIEEDDVMALLGRKKNANVFSLIDSIDNKNLSSALEIINSLLEEGEEPIHILGVITSRLRQYLLGSIFLEGGDSSEVILEKLKLNSFYNKNFVSYIRGFSVSGLVVKFQKILTADIDIKTGKMPPKLALERLIVDLMLPSLKNVSN